jgi:hypothetical protein
MGTIRDIVINLLSSAIWALGGCLFARLTFLKKSLVVICF